MLSLLVTSWVVPPLNPTTLPVVLKFAATALTPTIVKTVVVAAPIL